jgi:hypothetical protein
VEAFAHRQIEAAEGTELHGNAAVPASNSAERRLCLKVSEKKLTVLVLRVSKSNFVLTDREGSAFLIDFHLSDRHLVNAALLFLSTNQ